ncbi:MAG: isopentenyl-diphosphate Delta-isomerase [Candidatus Magasanikbacteria bacterium]|nr:isopentenyl-diphosphate Delta-isomerase [Candidatus Magasanikbacteria bacterium]
MIENVILVDKNDSEIGVEEKHSAHKAGKLHRAISVFLFNSKGETLLQKRESGKYHSGGLWTNTCCGHQRPGDDTVSTAKRKLKEEMGIECELKEIFSFIYFVKFDNGMHEHEFDHVLFGKFDGEPKPDPSEAEGWRWVGIDALEKEIEAHPEQFTYWLKECLPQLKNHPD